MKKIVESIKQNKIFLIAFFVSVSLLIIYCFDKNIYNVDESLSYALSNFDMGWLDYPSNGILTRYQMDGYRATNYLFNYEMVWHWQALDEHPPLYYALIHTVCSITPYVLSKWSPLIINIVFFALTLMLLYRILNELNNHRSINAIVCLMYGSSPVVLQYTTVIRMYVMLTFAFVLFVYGCIRLVKTGNKMFLLVLYLATVIGGLTNYFYYVFLLVFCVLMLLLFFALKLDRKLLGLSVITVVLAVLTNLAIFPYVLDLFFQERNSALTAFSNIETNLINVRRVIAQLKQAPYGLYGTILCVLVAVVTLVYSIIKEGFNLKFGLHAVCILAYFLYFALISTMAFETSYRFVSPIDPLLFIGVGFGLNCFADGLKHHYSFVLYVAILGVHFALAGIPKITVDEYQPLTYAKEHENSNLIIATPKGTPHYEIDRIFMERDHYGFVYNMTLTSESYNTGDDLYWMDNAVIYVHQAFDDTALQSWIETKTNLNSIEDTGIRSYEYKIYYAH